MQTLTSSTLSPVTAVSPGSPTTPGSASVAGTFTWSNGGLIPTAGTDSESVTFTPTDMTDYNTVGRCCHGYGEQGDTDDLDLADSQRPFRRSDSVRVDAVGRHGYLWRFAVPGSFAWTTPTTVPPMGSAPEGVTFTPTDTADYNTVTVTVTITVNSKTTPTITTWPTASAIIYGQTLALIGADGWHGFRSRHVRLDHAGDSSRLRVRLRRA